MTNEIISYKEASEITQKKVLVNSAILNNIQERIQKQGDSCSCSDYENCQYENRD